MRELKQASFKLLAPIIDYFLLMMLIIFALSYMGCANNTSEHATLRKPTDQILHQTKISVTDPNSPFIQFLGAAQMVGGSCYLIDTGKTRLLIDFGLFYGAEYQDKNNIIDFDPKTIDIVLLTHAHIDHAGRIPMLYRHGFKGKVIGTDATKSLAGVMLEMSLRVSEDLGTAIYDHKDYSKTMRNYVSVQYDQIEDIANDVSVRFRDAGHILGSSIIEIWIKNKGGTIKVVATGDMGAESIPLLRNPVFISEGDYFLIESTYGATQRGRSDYKAFGRDIQNTINTGGSVLIPAFVLDKTQKLIYVLGQLKREGIIANEVPVYADSSTGHEITNIYRKYTQYYNSEATSLFSASGDPLSFPSLFEVSGKVALKNHDKSRPAIYLTSSGMLDHANAPKHLERMIDNPKNLLAIVGWQAPDSLGRKMQEGMTKVEIPIESYDQGKKSIRYVTKSVKIKVKKYSMFSSHTDCCNTLKWLSHIPKTKEIYVVHGEKESTLALANTITTKLGFKTIAPSLGEKIYLTIDKKDYILQQMEPLCGDVDESIDLKSIADQ